MTFCLQVLVEFGIKSDDDRRERKDCGGGSTIDMGVYCLNLAQWVYGEEPTKVLAGGHMNSDGVDVSVSGTLLYSKGRTASFQTQFRVSTFSFRRFLGCVSLTVVAGLDCLWSSHLWHQGKDQDEVPFLELQQAWDARWLWSHIPASTWQVWLQLLEQCWTWIRSQPRPWMLEEGTSGKPCHSSQGQQIAGRTYGECSQTSWRTLWSRWLKCLLFIYTANLEIIQINEKTRN